MNCARKIRYTLLTAVAVPFVLAAGEASALCAGNENNAVPATAPLATFIDNNDGTLTHRTTGLQWARCSEGQVWDGSTCTGTPARFTWSAALVQADASVLAGHGDWRLPNMKELESIVEARCWSPAVDGAAFPATPAEGYWSSTPYVGDGGTVVVVTFATGEVSWAPKSGEAPARLVRGGR